MNDLLKEFELETGIIRNTSRAFLEIYIKWLENKAKQACCVSCDFYYDCYESD